MKLKESLVFVLLVTGIVAAFGGIALVSRGAPAGWIGVVLAVPMLFAVQSSMRAVRAPIRERPKLEAAGPANEKASAES